MFIIQIRIYFPDLFPQFSGLGQVVSIVAIVLATGRSKSGAAANSTGDITMHHWPLQLQKDAIIALHLSPDSVVVTSVTE